MSNTWLTMLLVLTHAAAFFGGLSLAKNIRAKLQEERDWLNSERARLQTKIADLETRGKAAVRSLSPKP